MVALLLPRSYSELSERRDWFALRKRLLLLAKSGRGAPDTDTEPVSSLKTENELRKSRKPLESFQFLFNDIFMFHVSELEVFTSDEKWFPCLAVKFPLPRDGNEHRAVSGSCVKRPATSAAVKGKAERLQRKIQLSTC